MEVLVFIDDCGHCRAFDVSTPDQLHKILEGICKEAAQKGHVQIDTKQEMKRLLDARSHDELIEFLSDSGIVDIGVRGGPSIVEAEKEWDFDTGLLS